MHQRFLKTLVEVSKHRNTVFMLFESQPFSNAVLWYLWKYTMVWKCIICILCWIDHSWVLRVTCYDKFTPGLTQILFRMINSVSSQWHLQLQEKIPFVVLFLHNHFMLWNFVLRSKGVVKVGVKVSWYENLTPPPPTPWEDFLNK